MMCSVVSTTLIVLALITNSFSQDIQFTPQIDGETLRNLIATDSKFLIGTRNATYRLRSDLFQEERKTLQSPNRLLIADSQNSTVLSCDEHICQLLETENLNNVRWEVARSMVLLSGGGNAAGSFSIGPNGTSDITFGEPASGNVARRFVKGALRNVGSVNTDEFFKYATWDGDDNGDTVNYLNTFLYSDYTYFTIQPSVSESNIHVVRFCQKDPGIKSNLQRIFTTRYEVRLRCASSAQDSILSTTATYLPFSSLFGGPLIFLSVNSMPGPSDVVTNVCAFRVDDINQKMLDKLTSCAKGGVDEFVDFNSEVPCPTHFTENQTQTQINEPCSLRSVLAGGLEVPDPLQEMALITNTSLSEQYTSLLASSLDDTLFLFAGTNTGKVHQFHLRTSNQSVFVRTIDLDPNSISVTKMLASGDGEYIYAMTANKLYRHTVDMCNTFTTCNSCATSRDPICGWCSLRGQCTRQRDCAPANDRTGVSQTVWIQANDSCPVISQATPSVIYFPELAATIGESVAIQLVTANINTVAALQNFDYQCRFVFSVPGSTPIARTAARSGSVFSCRSPVNSQVPPLPSGKDTVATTVSLRVVQTNTDLVTLATTLGFTDCLIHTNCTGCITSGVDKCRWCPFSHKCIPDKQSFQCNADDSTELTVGHDDECPQIKPSPLTVQYLVHANHLYPSSPLLVTTSNLSTFRPQFETGQFNCVICDDASCASPLFIVPAVLDESGLQVSCLQTIYSTGLSIDRLDVELRVVGDGDRRIDNPDNAKVTLYDCANLGTNCGQCLSIPNRYSCSYCGPVGGGRCRLDSLCGGAEFSFSDASQFANCESPTITSFSPMAGPTKGGTEVTIHGTNLGAERDHVMNVMIDGVPCNITEYTPGVLIKCMTGAMEGSLVTDKISVVLKYRNSPVTSEEDFMFKTPILLIPPAIPNQGPQSGGTNITVNGKDLGIGSNHQVFVGNQPCEITSVQQDILYCTTSSSSVGVGQVVRVHVDNWSSEISGFEYVEDPVFVSIQPKLFFASGGTNFTIKGERLDSIQNPRLLIYVSVANGRRRRQTVAQERITLVSETCLREGRETLHCLAPLVDLNGSSADVSFGLLLDNVLSVMELNGSLTVHTNPTFHNFPVEMMFTQTDRITLTIEGERFIFTSEQVKVRISPCTTNLGYCDCVVNNITNQNTVTCEVTNTNDLNLDQVLQVTVHLGYYEQSVGTLLVQQGPNLLIILIPIFAIIIIVSVTILIILVGVFCCHSRKKDQRYDQLILELEKLESSVARECKLGFAELQTDLDELTGDVTGCRLPYRDMQTYLLTTLFPGARDHPVLHPLQVPTHRQPLVNRALEDFNHLIHDKKVLLIFVRSLEEERGFTMRDKSIFGSLLIVALINRFDYATDVLKSLLADLIRRTVANSSPKLLLRRTETVAERMLTNWLAFCLHGYIMEHVGQPLYLTYRAVKAQLEKGPIDVITGEARYSLSEQKLIRQKMDVEVIDVFVDSEDGLRIPVKLLDCDTISQVKEKLLDASFKAAPVAQRPSLKSVDLVHIKSPTVQAILRDEDRSTVMEGSWKKINTLKHYWVQNGALFRLVRRKEHPPPGRAFDYPGSLISSHTQRQRALSEAEDGTRVWHLFKQLDVEDPRRSPFLNKKMVTEIYLPRMLSTKSILQKFVDDLFHSLFTISHPPVSPTATFSAAFPQSPGVQVPMGYAPGADAVPMAVKYLFDFLDDEADSAKILDADVVHTWKNNALSLRFWVNMIKNPEFIFDINKSHTVDACLSVIAQAFIDGCSFADMKLNIDSPTSKLLYNKEVQGYKAQVRQYYDDIRSLPRVPEDAMQYYLKQLSVYQARMTKNSGGFVVESALYELMRYASKYRDPIVTNLRTAGLESKAHLFEGIVKVLQH